MSNLVKRLDSYLTELVTEEADAAPLIDETIEEMERLQAIMYDEVYRCPNCKYDFVPAI